jgi:hypothetical protein
LSLRKKDEKGFGQNIAIIDGNRRRLSRTSRKHSASSDKLVVGVTILLSFLLGMTFIGGSLPDAEDTTSDVSSYSIDDLRTTIRSQIGINTFERLIHFDSEFRSELEAYAKDLCNRSGIQGSFTYYGLANPYYECLVQYGGELFVPIFVTYSGGSSFIYADLDGDRLVTSKDQHMLLSFLTTIAQDEHVDDQDYVYANGTNVHNWMRDQYNTEAVWAEDFSNREKDFGLGFTSLAVAQAVIPMLASGGIAGSAGLAQLLTGGMGSLGSWMTLASNLIELGGLSGLVLESCAVIASDYSFAASLNSIGESYQNLFGDLSTYLGLAGTVTDMITGYLVMKQCAAAFGQEWVEDALTHMNAHPDEAAGFITEAVEDAHDKISWTNLIEDAVTTVLGALSVDNSDQARTCYMDSVDLAQVSQLDREVAGIITEFRDGTASAEDVVDYYQKVKIKQAVLALVFDRMAEQAESNLWGQVFGITYPKVIMSGIDIIANWLTGDSVQEAIDNMRTMRDEAKSSVETWIRIRGPLDAEKAWEDKLEVVLAPLVPEEPHHSTVRLCSGTGSFSGVNPTMKSIRVYATSSFTGSLTIALDNKNADGVQVPLILTPSWGYFSSSYRTLDSMIETGVSYLDTGSFSFTAPSIAGRYYIVFAFHTATGGAFVASATDPSMGAPIWEDGNDIAAFPTSRFTDAQSQGYTEVLWQIPSGYTLEELAADAITVDVESYDDSSAPVTIPSISGPVGLNGYFIGPVTVTLYAYDVGASGVRCTYYAESGATLYWQPYTVPLTYTTTEEVYFRSVDNAGNTEDIGLVRLNVDMDRPVTTMRAWSTTSGTDVQFFWYDSSSWVNTTMYALDSGDWQQYQGNPFSVGMGMHELRYYSIDSAGNMEIENSARVGLEELGWIHTVVDNVSVVDGGPTGVISVAADSQDRLHVAYHDRTSGNLKYAMLSSGTWTVATIDYDSVVGINNDIAVDSSDAVHVAYCDYTDSSLKYATNMNGTWTNEVVDDAGDVGTTPSIAIGPDDRIHICYYDVTNRDLKCAISVGGSWQTSVVDATGDVGVMPSMAVDMSGRPHISYLDYGNADLKYAVNLDGSWQISVVDSVGSIGWYCDIALDSFGKAHISYMDNTNIDLKYATNADGSWMTTAVDSAEAVGWYSRIAIDSQDKAHITYTDCLSSFHPRYAHNTQGEWICSRINCTTWGFDGAIAVDSSDNLHVLFSGGDYGKYNLHYVTDRAGVPTAPLNLTTVSGTQEVTLNWSEPAFDGGSDIIGYGILRETSPGVFGEVGNTSAATVNYTDRSLENGTLYRYKVIARNSVGEGISSEVSESFTNFCPIAHFAVSPVEGNISTSFQFDASSSSDIEDAGIALKLRWDWEGDDIWNTAWDTLWSSNKTISHGFLHPGEYQVRLGVMDSGGLVNYTSLTVAVRNEAPTANLSAVQVLGDLSTVFVFDCSASYDLEDQLEVISARWDFDGDGVWDTDWSTEKAVTHLYSSPGIYIVQLEVRDPEGLTDVAEVQIEVVEVIPEFSHVVVCILAQLVVCATAVVARRRRDRP